MPKILLFNSIRMVMRADKLCRENGFAVKVMPVPHTHSTECGMSLVVNDEDFEDIAKSLISIEFKAIDKF